MIGKRIFDRFLAAGKCLFIDRARESETTFLLSSGRSGSTWLGSALHSLPGTRMIFEPFHARTGYPSLSKYRYTFVPPESTTEPVAAEVKALLAASSRIPWIEQFNRFGTFIYRRRLVKEVRINLLLPLLLAQLQECRYILLLRHPAAVAQSQVRTGWSLSPEQLFEQPGLENTDWLRDLRKLELSGDPFERNLVFWAIENRIALDAARAAGIPILLYEEVCVDPESQLSRLESYLGVTFPPTALEGMAKASWSTRKAVSDYSVEEKIAAWQTRTSPGQVDMMLRVLEKAGLDFVYNRDPVPGTTFSK